MPAPAATDRLMPLLAGVSRSFYLSIRLLPRAMREPVALGYLLARACDTLADTTAAPAALRLRWLDGLSAEIAGATCAATHDELTRWQAEGAEKDLMARLPECLRLLAKLDLADREDVRSVLSQITRGQRQDLERFELRSDAPALDRTQLDDYTFAVAGSVGEFWTHLAARHVAGFAALPTAEMLALGRAYGQALQLVNILRDESEDLARGRRYLPEGEPREQLLRRAHDGLACGIRYAQAVRPARLRIASALPALIGVRTLRLIEGAPPGSHVKVPRTQVRQLVLRLLLTLGSRRTLHALFRAPGDTAARWENAGP